jgi:hypothetical protein
LTTLSTVERKLCSPHGRAKLPLPWGEYGTRPTPISAHIAISSGSSWRRSKLYWFCIDTNRVQLPTSIATLGGRGSGNIGIGFAVPIDHALDVARQILAPG